MLKAINYYHEELRLRSHMMCGTVSDNLIAIVETFALSHAYIHLLFLNLGYCRMIFWPTSACKGEGTKSRSKIQCFARLPFVSKQFSSSNITRI